MQLTPIYDRAPILEIEGVGNPSAAVIRQRRRLAMTLSMLNDKQWAVQSRCELWTVKDVVSHLIATDGFWALSFTAGLRDEPTKFLASFDPVASPEQGVDRMRALSPTEVLGQYTAACDAFLQVIQTMPLDGWSKLAEAPPGHLAMNVAALHALWDAWIHERDITLSLGQVPVEDAEEMTLILKYAAALSPVFDAAKADRHTGTLAVVATSPDIAFTVEVGATVIVRDGACDTGPRLTGRAVDLIEQLSHRAPLQHALDADDAWLLAGLAEVFDLA